MKETRITVRIPDDLVAHIDATVERERASGDRKSDRTAVVLASLYLHRLACMPAAERRARVRQLSDDGAQVSDGEKQLLLGVTGSDGTAQGGGDGNGKADMVDQSDGLGGDGGALAQAE
jgi:hypothetical protein